MIIGIGGKLGSGKSVIAAHLVRQYGATDVAFASALRLELLDRLPMTLRVLHDAQDVHVNGCDAGDYDSCLREMLYVTKPRGFRELLQEYGSGVRRRDSITWWTDRWRERIEGVALVVAPDVRFPNEALAVRGLGGVLWRVERPGVGGGTHSSETLMDDWSDWDAIIRNDGTIEDLKAQVDAALDTLRVRSAGQATKSIDRGIAVP